MLRGAVEEVAHERQAIGRAAIIIGDHRMRRGAVTIMLITDHGCSLLQSYLRPPADIGKQGWYSLLRHCGMGRTVALLSLYITQSTLSVQESPVRCEVLVVCGGTRRSKHAALVRWPR